MNNILRTIVCLLLIIPTSCGYYSQYVENERQLKTCRLHCLEKLEKCKVTCKNNCRDCNATGNIQAALRFKKYKEQQNVQGKVVALELQSFKDPLQCRKVTCSCQEDYRVCAQACRGKIYKYLKARAAC